MVFMLTIRALFAQKRRRDGDLLAKRNPFETFAQLTKREMHVIVFNYQTVVAESGNLAAKTNVML